MVRYLFLALTLYSPVANSTETYIGEQTVVRNISETRDYTSLFRKLRKNHIEFTLSIPEHNVKLHVDYYQQYDVVTRAFTISVIEEATEIFFAWTESKGHTLTNDRRDHRTLAIYDLDYDTLNDRSVISFTSISRQRQTKRVNALYEAHRTPDGSNAILIGANRAASEKSRATTIAHELAHWWCDYFRIYDRYYMKSDGKVDMEGPAYDFQRYFSRRTKY
jgi:hypothetical protein